MEKVRTDFPILLAQIGPLNGQRWIIDKMITIGRDVSCELVIPDRQVSRFHAKLVPISNGITFEDLGSKNGSFLNGALLTNLSQLDDGDMLQIALVQNFIFLSSDATLPLDSAAFFGQEKSGRLQLDNRSRQVWINRAELVPALSVPQFRLLQALYDQQGQVVTREQLVEAIWGHGEAVGVTEQALDALVRRLRDRLSALDTTHNFLVTIRGHGLRLDNPVE